MNNKVVFLSVILLSACSSKNPYYEKLYGSWTCNGKGISLAADTYHNNGKFSRYLHENGQVMLQEGTFVLNENLLRIKIDRQAFQINTEVAKLSVPIIYQYKINRLSVRLLDFRKSRPSVGPLFKQKLQTCRKVFEQRTGFFYASAKIGRLEKDSNQLREVESPITMAIREHSFSAATKKVAIVKHPEEKISSPVTTVKSEPPKLAQRKRTQDDISSGKKSPDKPQVNNTKIVKTKIVSVKTKKTLAPILRETVKSRDEPKNQTPVVLAKNNKSINVKEPATKDSANNKSNDEKTTPIASGKDRGPGISKDLSVNKRIVLNNGKVIITINKRAQKDKSREQSIQADKKVIISIRSMPILKLNKKSGIPLNLKNLLRKQKYLARQIRILDALQRDRNRAYDTLRALSQAMVPRLSLISVQQKDNRFTITGRAAESAAVNMFTKNLSHSPHLRKVSLKRVYTHGNGKTFTINFRQAHSVRSYQYLQIRQAVTQQNKVGAKRRIRELRALRDSLLKRFPSKIEARSLVRKLKWKAKKVGLKVIRFERQKDVKQGSYNLVQVRIEAVGDYDSVIVFLNRLGRRKHVNRVRNLQLRIQNDTRSGTRVVESLYISMTLDLIRMSDRLQRQRKRVPNLKFRFVEMSPYNRVPYSDDEGLRNPFRVITGRFVEYCNGPLNNIQINKVRLVAILNKRKHMALLKTPDGKIYRARYGTCIARNTRISRITHKSIVLKTVKVKYGRPTVVVRNIKLQTD